MEFLGYKSQTDEKKVYKYKPSTFKYFNQKQRKNRPRYPITDHLSKEQIDLLPIKHEDEPVNSDDENYMRAMSEHEHELHRIRDRVRIRINLLDIDF